MKKFLKEFKEFAMRGSVIDMAVGVIIGGAFKDIVTSLVNDVISPVIGILANKDFSAFSINFFGADIRYGSFITGVINFIIMAFVIFLLVKGLNKLAELRKKHEEPQMPLTKRCPYCCTDISTEATRCPNCTSELEVNV